MNPPKLSQTNITLKQREVFNALTSGQYSNFGLFSCFVNGEPATAIVVVEPDEASGDYLITPLFVSLTDSMVLVDHEGTALADPTSPAWATEIDACDRLEIHPVCDVHWNDAEQGPRPFSVTDDRDACYETCTADQAHFWSVYGHLKTGGLTCFEDFATEAEALAFAEKLYGAYPHLIR